MDINPKAYLLDGNQMPLIAFGTMNIKPNDKNFNLADFITQALNIGYTHFDLAKFFQNQVQIGDAFKIIFQQKKPVLNQQGQPVPGQFQQTYARQNLFFSLKVYNVKGKNLIEQVKASLTNLRLTYIDLLILDFTFSPTTSPPLAEGEQIGQTKVVQQINHLPIFQIWKQMQKCKQLNLCKSIGVANFSFQALLNLIPFTKNIPVVNQVESHCYLTQKKMLNFLKKHKMVMSAYCPLARGGKDQKIILGDKVDIGGQPILKNLSQKYSKSIHQILLNYQICRGVAVCPKTEKLEHLKDNFNITDFELFPQDVQKLQSLNQNGKIRVYIPKNLPFWKGLDPLC